MHKHATAQEISMLLRTAIAHFQFRILSEYAQLSFQLYNQKQLGAAARNLPIDKQVTRGFATKEYKVDRSEALEMLRLFENWLQLPKQIVEATEEHLAPIDDSKIFGPPDWMASELCLMTGLPIDLARCLSTQLRVFDLSNYSFDEQVTESLPGTWSQFELPCRSFVLKLPYPVALRSPGDVEQHADSFMVSATDYGTLRIWPLWKPLRGTAPRFKQSQIQSLLRSLKSKPKNGIAAVYKQFERLAIPFSARMPAAFSVEVAVWEEPMLSRSVSHPEVRVVLPDDKKEMWLIDGFSMSSQEYEELSKVIASSVMGALLELVRPGVSVVTEMVESTGDRRRVTQQRNRHLDTITDPDELCTIGRFDTKQLGREGTVVRQCGTVSFGWERGYCEVGGYWRRPAGTSPDHPKTVWVEGYQVHPEKRPSGPQVGRMTRARRIS